MPKVNSLTMKKLDELVEEIEAMEPAIEPALDCEAYCKRELLAALDRAHELLACLVADVEQDLDNQIEALGKTGGTPAPKQP